MYQYTTQPGRACAVQYMEVTSWYCLGTLLGSSRYSCRTLRFAESACMHVSPSCRVHVVLHAECINRAQTSDSSSRLVHVLLAWLPLGSPLSVLGFLGL